MTNLCENYEGILEIHIHATLEGAQAKVKALIAEHDSERNAKKYNWSPLEPSFYDMPGTIEHWTCGGSQFIEIITKTIQD